MNGSHPKPSVFLPKLFNFFKDQSLQSNKPLFQRLFEDPFATSIGDPQLLKQLQQHVNDDPDYQLPPGFIKYKQPAVTNSYKAPEEKTDNERMVIELLDDIFKDTIGIHMLDPQMELREDVWIVKPDIFQQKKKRERRPTFDRVPEKHKFDGAGRNLSNYEYEQRQMKYGLTPARSES